MNYFACIDIGGTSIKYGIINEFGKLVEKASLDTEAAMGGASIVAKAKQIVKGYQKIYSLSGICISTAGMVDVKTGNVFFSGPQIPDYAGTNWKEIMENEFHISCEVENDVNCAGLAEVNNGAGKKSRIALCLTIGTGIGGCAIIDGYVFHGSHNCGCEVGYIQLKDGAFQDIASTTALVKNIAARKCCHTEEINGHTIFQMVKENDTICIEELNRLADHIGCGIANICYVLNPDTVILGGGIMEQEDFFKPLIQKALEKYLIPHLASQITLAFAKNKNSAGMLGAFYHFHQMQNKIH